MVYSKMCYSMAYNIARCIRLLRNVCGSAAVLLGLLLPVLALHGATACYLMAATIDDSNKEKQQSDSYNDDDVSAGERKVTAEELLMVRDDDSVFGCEDAQNILIEYSSFACPHCAENHRKYFAQFKEDYIDNCKVKYIYRNFPTTLSASFASILQYCNRGNKEVVDALFRSQVSWAFSVQYAAKLVNIMKVMNIMTDAEIKACVSDSNIAGNIKSQAYLAATVLEVDRTPTFFLNGRKMARSFAFNDLKHYID